MKEKSLTQLNRLNSCLLTTSTCSAILYEFGVNVRALISGGGRVGGDVLGEEEEVVVIGVEGARAGVQLGRLGDLEEDGRGREHVLVEVGEDDLLDRGWK